MLRALQALVDGFVPPALSRNQSERMLVRNFIILHLVGPVMGHSVTVYLGWKIGVSGWQFWVLEAGVAAFLLVPALLRVTGSLAVAAMASVQMLIAVSLFGSYHFGGISSPMLPWFLIAMMLGFFYLADRFAMVLAGLALQLGVFVAARFQAGAFPDLVPVDALAVPSLLSVVAAATYMTLLCVFYEGVMRFSLKLEQEMRDQLRANDQLRNAMRDAQVASERKSIFLAKMSHKLRTPLNAVIGYTEMIREDWAETKADPRKAEDVARIHAAGRHLLALVDEVIDLSAIQASRTDSHQEPVHLRRLIDDVVSTAHPLIGKRDNKLIVSVASDATWVMLDALKMRQSLLNLLSNAAKFTTKSVIMLTVVETQADNRDWLAFEVTDNGIGMRAEALERIFESFRQAEKDTSTQFGGTGLGLALTRRFCEMMGGRIDVRSQYGVGSAFTITVPFVPVADDQLAGASSAAGLARAIAA